MLEENHAAPVVAFQAWVKVGSADEPPELAGIAHVFEHMLFKGTETPRGRADRPGGRGRGRRDQRLDQLRRDRLPPGAGQPLLRHRPRHPGRHAAATRPSTPRSSSASARWCSRRSSRARTIPIAWRRRGCSRPPSTQHPYGRPIIGSSETRAGADPRSAVRVLQAALRRLQRHAGGGRRRRRRPRPAPPSSAAFGDMPGGRPAGRAPGAAATGGAPGSARWPATSRRASCCSASASRRSTTRTSRRWICWRSCWGRGRARA